MIERQGPLIEPDEGKSSLLEHVIEHTPLSIALSTKYWSDILEQNPKKNANFRTQTLDVDRF